MFVTLMFVTRACTLTLRTYVGDVSYHGMYGSRYASGNHPTTGALPPDTDTLKFDPPTHATSAGA